MILNHSVHFKVKLLKWTESSPDCYVYFDGSGNTAREANIAQKYTISTGKYI